MWANHVQPGQIVAKLEPQDELNALRSAQAAVAAAQAQFVQAKSHFDRQRTLLARDVASRAQFEQAEQALETARAQLDTAEAQQKAAKDRVSYTELHVDAAGIVVATAAEPGEVVQAGQVIIRIARKDGRDAVFDVPGQVLRSAPADPLIAVSPHGRPRGHRDRPGAGGIAAGRPGYPHVRSQGRLDRSAPRPAARRDRYGAHAA